MQSAAECVVDLSALWAVHVIFAVCCRNPNCINVCSESNWYSSKYDGYIPSLTKIFLANIIL